MIPIEVAIITNEMERVLELVTGLNERGLSCLIIGDGDDVIEQIIEQSPKLLLLDMGNPFSVEKTYMLPKKIKREKKLPIIALLSRETLNSLEPRLSIDDFVVEPWDSNEIALRVRRIFWHANKAVEGKIIECGDLIIDLENYEVTINGSLVMLTYKEYELLKYLATNRGRVITRETLLNEIWGYDYFGGDRTVDVHIRRLRSKIEDPTHSFIETVRNIGYRFKKDF